MSRHEPEDSLTHYFSTHFYTTLAEKGVERVQRWNARKGIDIFKKRLVFIPINKYLHWSLAVIVNPGAIENYKTRDPDAPFPLILFFDSLNMHTKSRVGTNLRKWIAAEWNRRLGMSDNEGANKDLFTRDSMRLYSPKGMNWFLVFGGFVWISLILCFPILQGFLGNKTATTVEFLCVAMHLG